LEKERQEKNLAQKKEQGRGIRATVKRDAGRSDLVPTGGWVVFGFSPEKKLLRLRNGAKVRQICPNPKETAPKVFVFQVRKPEIRNNHMVVLLVAPGPSGVRKQAGVTRSIDKKRSQLTVIGGFCSQDNFKGGKGGTKRVRGGFGTEDKGG